VEERREQRETKTVWFNGCSDKGQLSLNLRIQLEIKSFSFTRTLWINPEPGVTHFEDQCMRSILTWTVRVNDEQLPSFVTTRCGFQKDVENVTVYLYIRKYLYTCVPGYLVQP
jgi:hypothetical protein